jgi:hypothetical protein
MGHVACKEDEEVHTKLPEKPERKRPLARTRRRSYDNTEMNLKETGCTGLHYFRTDSNGGLL